MPSPRRGTSWLLMIRRTRSRKLSGYVLESLASSFRCLPDGLVHFFKTCFGLRPVCGESRWIRVTSIRSGLSTTSFLFSASAITSAPAECAKLRKRIMITCSKYGRAECCAYSIDILTQLCFFCFLTKFSIVAESFSLTYPRYNLVCARA